MHPIPSAAETLFTELQALPPITLEESRPEIVACVSRFREAQMAGARACFEQGGSAAELTQALSEVMDIVIKSLCRLLTPSSLGFAVMATGGYGRAELFPYSDVDLLFLYRPAARGPAERLSRTLLYVLWDMGLKVGHALRAENDALELAMEDISIRTNMLDARLVAGDPEMAAQLITRFRENIAALPPQEFVEAKLVEREERLKRFGDSRYLLEPNIKEGKGGLRDLHTIYWLARYIYNCDMQGMVKRGHLTGAEYRSYMKAHNFLSALRVHLHLMAGKADERLTFDRQMVIAPRMGYRQQMETQSVERMMKHYFMIADSVGTLTRIVCALLEEQHKRRIPGGPHPIEINGFIRQGGRLNITHAENFAEMPLRMLELFQVAQQEQCQIHPRALQAVSRNLRAITHDILEDQQANTLFLEILLNPQGSEQALRRMKEVGLLGRFIPPFGRVIGQMQFNMYHIYTVDEHTLVALGVLHNLEQGRYVEEMPIASQVAHNVEHRKVLYLALLCHDLAKGKGTDHSKGGAAIAKKMAERFDFSAAETELIIWLVRQHLLFTHTAFKRDLNDPHALQEFVGTVQSLTKLKLLFLMTVADMRAVGPGVWNAWKANLLRDLYHRAERYITTGRMETGEQQVADLIKELQPRLPDWSVTRIEDYITLCPPDYLTGMDADGLARGALLLATLTGANEPLKLDVMQDPVRGITELTVLAEDRQGLFSKLAGAISLSGANILGAKIFTLRGGMAVDVFQVQNPEGGLFDRPDRLSRMAVRMRQAIAGELDLSKELARHKLPISLRRDNIPVEAQVFIENDASPTHTVIEVVGRDRIGFLYAVTRVLADLGLSISSAHISTYGAQAVDVFYVKDRFGLKMTHPQQLKELREALLRAAAPEEIQALNSTAE